MELDIKELYPMMFEKLFDNAEKLDNPEDFQQMLDDFLQMTNDEKAARLTVKESK